MWNGNEEVTGAAVDAAVERALGWLHRSQLPSGEFRSYLSTDHALERDRVFDSSPFPTALIAYSLGFAGGARAAASFRDRSISRNLKLPFSR